MSKTPQRWLDIPFFFTPDAPANSFFRIFSKEIFFFSMRTKNMRQLLPCFTFSNHNHRHQQTKQKKCGSNFFPLFSWCQKKRERNRERRRESSSWTKTIQSVITVEMVAAFFLLLFHSRLHSIATSNSLWCLHLAQSMSNSAVLQMCCNDFFRFFLT